MLDEGSQFCEHTDIVVRELSHRTANILQVAIAALQLGLEGRTDAVQLALGQLMAKGEVNKLLAPAGDAPVDLADRLMQVCDATGRSLRSGQTVDLVVDAPRLLAPGRKVRRLSMIAAELVANSVRHAFADGEGSILLAIRDDGVHTGLLVEDDGRCRGWARRGGQGGGIVDALAGTMGGHVRRSLTPQGALSVQVVVPTIAAALQTPAGTA